MGIKRVLLKVYTLPVLLVTIGNASLFAQNQKNFVVKNSLTLNWQEDIGLVKDILSASSLYDTTRIFSMDVVNPAVMFSSNTRSHHEIELSRLAFSTNEETITLHYDSIMQLGRIQHFDERLFQLSVAYYYNHRFSRTPKSMEFYLGTGVSYSTSSSTKVPVSGQIYPWFTRKSNKHQLDILLRPKVLYHLSPKLVLDVNLGISLYQYYVSSNTNAGSILTTEPEESKLKKEDSFAQMFRMSVGIGYKL